MIVCVYICIYLPTQSLCDNDIKTAVVPLSAMCSVPRRGFWDDDDVFHLPVYPQTPPSLSGVIKIIEAPHA